MSEAEYSGSCYCGAIGFRYTTSVAPPDWSVRACQCGFCVAHAALSTSDPAGELFFVSKEPSQLRRYRFALRTADFLLCTNCGVYIGAVIETERGRFGIVNTRALTPDPPDLAEVAPARYDGEDTADRVTRREDRWTPVTSVPWQ